MSTLIVLLLRTTSTYVPLYSKLEHRVLLLIGWPLSSFLQLDRFLNFSLRIHRNAHSDRRSYFSSLFVRNNASLTKKHANPSNAINVHFVFHTTQCIHSRHTYIYTQCVLKYTHYYARTAVWVLHRKGHATIQHVRALICR